jgi:hypothetical protein
VLDASALATTFRGYEVILEGRDPRDAIFHLEPRRWDQWWRAPERLGAGL